MKKKVLALSLSLAMTFAMVAGCGSTSTSTATASTATASTAAASTAASTAAASTAASTAAASTATVSTAASAATSTAASTAASTSADSTSGGTEDELVADANPDLGGKKIYVIIKNTTAPFFISIKEGAEAAGKELGVDVEVQAPVNTSEGGGNEEQSQLVEQTIVNDAAAVVICPLDTKSIVPAVQKVVDAKIPVVSLNTKMSDMSLAETFVGLENYNQAYSTAKVLAEGLGGKGKIFLIEGTSGAQTSIDRTEGAKAAFAEYPDIQIVADQSADYSRATAMNVVQNLLQQYPDVTGIFCCNDEMALGSIEAVDAAGLTGKIKISGQDANADAQQAIKDGTLYASSYGNPYGQGHGAVVAAVMGLEGKTLKDAYYIKTVDVTSENINTFNS